MLSLNNAAFSNFVGLLLDLFTRSATTCKYTPWFTQIRVYLFGLRMVIDLSLLYNHAFN